MADVCGCWGWDGGNGTWESGGLRGCPEGEDARLGLALLILCHDANLVLRIPVQAAQHHILAAMGEADLWFPVRPVLLRKECGGDKTLKAGRLSENVVIIYRHKGKGVISETFATTQFS